MTKEEALKKIEELKQFILDSEKGIEIEMVDVVNKAFHDFRMGKYLVTQEQWKTVMGNNPSYFKGDNLPVENVSWKDVQEFIKILNRLTKKEYRLPTDYEWLICATIDGTTFSGSNNIEEVGWFVSNSFGKTHPVGLKKPNSLNIYDMSGNVWEWCDNACRDGYILRGGSWYNDPADLRCAYRYSYSPDDRNTGIGFRLAETIK